MAERRAFRPDIEGLRAISVLAVVWWHAGIGWLPGGYIGVDVFFVISGYLMTSVLFREAQLHGSVSMSKFYARRARRLLPAALAALSGTALLTVILLPPQRWASIGADIVASAGYVVNWRLAGGAVDYLSQDDPPSPLQHFWSLAVEEQFYFVWPLLIVIAVLVARRLRLKLHLVMILLVAATFATSYGLSIAVTASDPSTAYLVTHTRVWELALGAAVALWVAQWDRIPTGLANVVGWLGLVMIFGSILRMDNTTAFPGWIAIIPTLGAALVLVSGSSASRPGPGVLLNLAPMQFLGSISYSWYLWHWPFVVVAMSLFGTGHDVPLGYGVGAVLLSLVPAWLSYQYVEQPTRRAGKKASTTATLHLGARCTLAGVTAGALLVVAAPVTAPQVDPTWATPSNVLAAQGLDGAKALAPDPAVSPAGAVVDDPGPATPSLGDLEADIPSYVPEGCRRGLEDPTVGQCLSGDPDGEFVMAVVGDSHAGQWTSALNQLGLVNGWRVVAMTKSSCPPIYETTDVGSDVASSCLAWNRDLSAAIDDLNPDLVLMSSAKYLSSGDEVIGNGLVASADRYTDDDTDVALIRDTPRPEENMGDCLLKNETTMSACAFDRAGGLSRSGTGHSVFAAQASGAGFIDLNEWICPQETCAPVIGGAVVYRDSNHVTNTYILTLQDALEGALLEYTK